MIDATSAPTAIRLLILSSSLDQSERITTFLRNGGLAVHSTRFADMDNLEKKLRSELFDLVLCCAFDDAVNLQQTLTAVNDLHGDLPLLIMSDQSGDPVEMLQAMRNGAMDLVDLEDLEHLQLVVAREFSNLQQRRELAELKQRLQECEERGLGLIESSREAIAFIQEGMHVRVNPAYLHVLGFENRDDVEDLPLLDIIDQGQHKVLRNAIKQLDMDSEQRSTSLETVCRRQDDDTLKATLHLSKASMDGEPCLQVIVREKQNSAEEMEKKLRRLSQLDSDTKLANRQYFMSQLESWCGTEAKDGECRALVYLAVDDIPKLRSSLGMSRSDELVKDVAELLRGEVSQQDLLARFSASSFALLCRRSTISEIEKLAEILRSKVDKTSYPDVDPALGPFCSIGVALISDIQPSVQDLVNEAYNASETAREKGGNQVVLLKEESEILQAAEQASEFVQQIDDALVKDRFHLVFQPIVSLQGDTRENYAVLVRMLDKNDKELLPEAFLEQAEQYGKMVDIDHWIIRRAISTLSAQRKDGRKVDFFITLSEQSLKDQDTLLWICDCLREFDARGGWLTFQIHETHARNNLQRMTQLIEGLKKIKCQIALDHFGMMPKPELLLNHLNVNYVKFASSFVQEINSNQEQQDELHRLNALAASRGVKTIATAVEDANSLTVLWTVGVGYIQGYFLQEPSEDIDYASNQRS